MHIGRKSTRRSKQFWPMFNAEFIRKIYWQTFTSSARTNERNDFPPYPVGRTHACGVFFELRIPAYLFPPLSPCSLRYMAKKPQAHHYFQKQVDLLAGKISAAIDDLLAQVRPLNERLHQLTGSPHSSLRSSAGAVREKVARRQNKNQSATHPPKQRRCNKGSRANYRVREIKR